MKNRTQYFTVAGLIFINSDEDTTSISEEDIREIQKRFSTIVESFTSSYENNYNSSFITGKSKLPYNSMVTIGTIGNYIEKIKKEGISMNTMTMNRNGYKRLNFETLNFVNTKETDNENVDNITPIHWAKEVLAGEKQVIIIK